MKEIKVFPILLIGLWMLPAFSVSAQGEEIEPRVDVSYFRTGDDLPYLKIVVRKRVERRYFPMKGMIVHAYFNEEKPERAMGTITTNDRGEGIIEMPTSAMEEWHKLHAFDFIATVDATDSSLAVDETLSIQKARIRMTTTDDKTIKAVIEHSDEEGWNPVEEIELKLFVKRQFGRLPITEDPLTSDADGSIEAESTDEVPGDAQGLLTVGCWLEDHDEFGNIIAYTTTKWGTPTVDDNSAFEQRTLWSTRDKTPLWLLIFPNLIIAGIWGIIFFLIYQIIKIKRISKPME